MFIELPPKRKVYPLRNPFVGSLGYHLRSSTPSPEKWDLDIDGQRYWWKDGEPVIFDEPLDQEAKNDKKKPV